MSLPPLISSYRKIMGLRIVSNVVKTIKFKLILFGTFFSWKQIKINDLVVVVVRVVWFEVVEEITVFFSNLARVFYEQPQFTLTNIHGENTNTC